MTPALKQSDLVSELLRIEDYQDRLAYIQDRVRKFAALDNNHRTQENQIKGCLTKVWLRSTYANGVCEFIADSESSMVRGLVVLIAQIYSNAKPEDVVAFDTTILSEVRLDRMITPTRQHGLMQLQKAIQEFARCCMESN